MDPLQKEWLLDMADDYRVDADDAVDAARSQVVGFAWDAIGARKEANNILSRITYKRRQIPQLGQKLADAMAQQIDDSRLAYPQIGSWLAGLVFVDVAQKSGWVVQRNGGTFTATGNVEDVDRDNRELSARAGILLRRQLHAILNITAGQLEGFAAYFGPKY